MNINAKLLDKMHILNECSVLGTWRQALMEVSGRESGE
jgi:hypothetical protein